ncbi:MULTISPECIES: hypothetical protein [unclassified Paludibacterium]|uniref:hypothetical protein n=1 Tax=unclassified Paludibacterium TaxID=2618429 RepID=UPI001C048868|nr:hypothetical protein [Paludibacterium sp. B53371]BEV73417.1 hypothetical protein THUN1379_28990 [Paludibacterium sp. THUN1379]
MPHPVDRLQLAAARHQRLAGILHHGIYQYCSDCAARHNIEALYVCLACGRTRCQACARERAGRHPDRLRCACGQPLARVARWAALPDAD